MLQPSIVTEYCLFSHLILGNIECCSARALVDVVGVSSKRAALPYVIVYLQTLSPAHQLMQSCRIFLHLDISSCLTIHSVSRRDQFKYTPIMFFPSRPKQLYHKCYVLYTIGYLDNCWIGIKTKSLYLRSRQEI